MKTPIVIHSQPFSTLDTADPASPAELIQIIPAVNYRVGTDRHFRRVAHLKVTDCLPGDRLNITASFEITNDLPGLVEFCAGLILTSDETGTAGLELMPSLSTSAHPSRGKFITRMTGYNLTPNANNQFPNGGMHHGKMDMNRMAYPIPHGMKGDLYVAIMCYIGGVNYWPTNDIVKVEPFTTHISLTKDRG